LYIIKETDPFIRIKKKKGKKGKEMSDWKRDRGSVVANVEQGKNPKTWAPRHGLDECGERKTTLTRMQNPSSRTDGHTLEYIGVRLDPAILFESR
jgi:hypothetical protein